MFILFCCIVELTSWTCRCVVSNAIVLADLILVSGFVGTAWQGYLRTAGILEWILTYFGGFYLLTFVGYLRYVIRRLLAHDCTNKQQGTGDDGSDERCR